MSKTNILIPMAGNGSRFAEKGYKLYSASYIYSIHVMGKQMLSDILKNNDPRSDITLKSLSKV